MRIALDAMGGDLAPLETVKGALQAAREDPGIEIVLVGDRRRIEEILEAEGAGSARIVVEHTTEVVSGTEEPLKALRRKENTSIARAAEMASTREVDAVVAVGNTGAAVAAAVFSLKMLEGIRRAGIATFLPTVKGRTVVIDVGANLRCKPEHLLQYGIMASVYSRFFLGRPRPEIALLNIGEEEAKGNDLVKETRRAFLESDLAFRGNIEGHDVFLDPADVVVCEGFVGNVLLKISEGLAEALQWMLGRGYTAESGRTEEERRALQKALEWLRARTDYQEYGGAPLLGVNGAFIIGHGRSEARAVANAIRSAKRFASTRVNDHIVEELHRLSLARS
jgi:glycerol-3-phosphate acyltransferase PlsX